MGALRAVELDLYGMVGLGKVYRQYREGKIEDDAEVALTFMPDSSYPLSEPMINIRASIDQAVCIGKITQDQAGRTIKDAEACFYANRDRASFLGRLEHIDQKEQDAISALHYLSTWQYNGPYKNGCDYPKTLYARALLNRANAEPFIKYYDWLPETEKIVLLARLYGNTYRDMKTLSLMFSVIERLSFSQGKNNSYMNNRLDLACLQNLSLPKSLLSKFRCFDQSMIFHKLLGLLRLNGRYKKGYNQLTLSTLLEVLSEDSIDQNVQLCLSLSWCLISSCVEQISVCPDEDVMRHYSRQFRQIHGLSTHQQLADWRIQNDLTKSQYIALIKDFFLIDYIVLRHNEGLIISDTSMQVRLGLLETIKICQAIEPVQNMLEKGICDHSIFQSTIKKCRNGELSAKNIDFVGQQDFEDFLVAQGLSGNCT